jgi:hypothetical protein
MTGAALAFASDVFESAITAYPPAYTAEEEYQQARWKQAGEAIDRTWKKK